MLAVKEYKIQRLFTVYSRQHQYRHGSSTSYENYNFLYRSHMNMSPCLNVSIRDGFTTTRTHRSRRHKLVVIRFPCVSAAWRSTSSIKTRIECTGIWSYWIKASTWWSTHQREVAISTPWSPRLICMTTSHTKYWVIWTDIHSVTTMRGEK
jgi:hypothetical protein